MAAYKQAMLHAGLPVEKWVARMLRYCADGAEVLPSTGNGVTGQLMKLQEEVFGSTVVIPMHANCHLADLALRDAMDDTHEFLDTVADTMTAVVAWFRNAPTRLPNLRRVAMSLDMLALQYGSPEPAAVGRLCCMRSARPVAHIPLHGVHPLRRSSWPAA